MGEIVFHDYAVNTTGRPWGVASDLCALPTQTRFFLDGQLPVILQASVLDLGHIENIFFTQRLCQGVQRVTDFSHVILKNFAVLDDDGRSAGYQPVARPAFECDLGHEEIDAEEHQQRYDDEPMVELIVKRQICRNAAHEVIDGHIGYRLLILDVIMRRTKAEIVRQITSTNACNGRIPCSNMWGMRYGSIILLFIIRMALKLLS